MTLFYQNVGFGNFPFGSIPFGGGGRSASMGFQVEIQRDEKYLASQVEITRGNLYLGSQAEIVKIQPMAFSAEIAIYNATNLRIMCEFASRGATAGTGNNSWGNPIAEGLNWQSTSIEPSPTDDFDVSNLNSDIVEQVFRSATGALNLTITCDTEISQGIFNDTLSMLNTNLTSGATVRLEASNTSNFSSVDFSENLSVGFGGDVVYIAPELPTIRYRYWRIAIEDPTNTDNFVSIGCVLFGTSVILHQECFVDRVDLEPVNFTDGVLTEAFTSVQNDRGIKNKLKLDFRNLNYNKINFSNMLNLFDFARTTLKCLWIPTPQYPHRFMTFGKLTTIPRQSHNVKGENADYVNMTINVDEAR